VTDSDADDSLAFEPGNWDPDIVRRDADTLAPLPLELGDRATFAPEPAVDIGAITGRLKPASDGLQIAADSDVLASCGNFKRTRNYAHYWTGRPGRSTTEKSWTR